MSLAITLHLISVIPALLLGLMILFLKKGTPFHKLMGRVWVTLMFVSSFTSFFIQSNGGYSWIHLLSAVSITSISLGIWGIRRGNVNMHKYCMLGAFSGMLIAGFFAAILPNRIVHTFLFGG